MTLERSRAANAFNVFTYFPRSALILLNRSKKDIGREYYKQIIESFIAYVTGCSKIKLP